MLPVYISYFAGQGEKGGKSRILINALGFVAGFSAIFILLGAFAGKLGGLFVRYSDIVNIVCGAIIILFGLNFIGIIRMPFINTNLQAGGGRPAAGFFSSVLFGIVFSVSWTPCVGTFLGSALMLAAGSGDITKGMVMLFCFSLGLALPFMISAVFIDGLKNTFDYIKKHYGIIKVISGVFLVAAGILTATGLFGYFYSWI
jgi:cytochrome c-type biogenesis protein